MEWKSDMSQHYLNYLIWNVWIANLQLCQHYISLYTSLTGSNASLYLLQISIEIKILSPKKILQRSLFSRNKPYQCTQTIYIRKQLKSLNFTGERLFI